MNPETKYMNVYNSLIYPAWNCAVSKHCSWLYAHILPWPQQPVLQFNNGLSSRFTEVKKSFC